MRSRTATILFTLFAPITLPAYALFLAFSNLLGGAFYIVIEASLSPLLRRPIALSRGQMAVFALPVLLLAPLFTAAHMLLWMVRLILSGLTWLGRWQAGTRSRWASLLIGGVWLLIALWTTVTCLNAAVGASWVGRPVRGQDIYVDGIERARALRDLPPDAQSRRNRLMDDLTRHKERVHPQWDAILSFLQDDENLFRWMRNEPLRRQLAGMPWYFVPAQVSEDGADHSALLLGPLVFAWMLLIRWPGMFRVLPNLPARFCGLLLRLGLCAGAIYHLVTWEPLTLYYGFWFMPTEIPFVFAALSPAHWLGIDYDLWIRPEWYLFNAGLWMILIALLAGGWFLAWRTAPLLGWPKYYVAFLASRLLQRKRIAFFSVGAVTLCVAMMIIVISVMGGFVDSIRNRAHGLLGDLVMDGSLQGFPLYQEFIDRICRLTDENGSPIVVQATPIVRTYGILQFPRNKKTAPVTVLGIRLDEYVRVNKFGEDLFYQRRFGHTHLGPQQQPVYGFNSQGLAVLPEELEANFQKYLESLPSPQREEETRQYYREPGDLFPGPGIFRGPEEQPGYTGKEYPGIIVGRSIIFRRLPSGDYRRSEFYPRGELCRLSVLPMTRGGEISTESPPQPTLRYVDDSRTGIHEIDTMNVYVDFDYLQQLLSMESQERADGSGMTGARCTQIQIKVRDDLGNDRRILALQKQRIYNEWEKLVAETPSDPFEYEMLRLVDISTWEEMQASYIAAIEKEKFLVLIMFGVISIVAIFLILCIFYMIVQEKTRDIGIIKSVGGSAEGVAAVFLAYGGAIGLVGCILGALLGTTFVEHINDIQDWLAKLNPDWRVWSPETYSFDKIPDVWKWSEVIWISILSIIASIIGAAFPALRAGRTWPVETLRYE